MMKLSEIGGETQLQAGTIIRVFGVGRFDIMKSDEDYTDAHKQQMDFYDFMLIDVSVISSGTFMLVNVTSDNKNRGTIFCLFENTDSKYWISAKTIKDYFEGNQNVFIHSNG